MGKLDEVRQILARLEKKTDLPQSDRLECQLLKGMLLFYQGEYENCLTLAQQVYLESQKLEQPLLVVEALLYKAQALFRLGKLDECLNVLNQSDQTLKHSTQDSLSHLTAKSRPFYHRKQSHSTLQHNLDQPSDNLEKLVRIDYLKAQVFLQKGAHDQALDYFQQNLILCEKLDDKSVIASHLGNIGAIYHQKGELIKALDYYRQSMKIFEEMKNKFHIMIVLHNIGMIYAERGMHDQALDFLMQSLKSGEEIENKDLVAYNLQNIAKIYRQQGDYERALKAFQQSLTLRQETGNNFYTAEVLLKLIMISLDSGFIEDAKEYLQQLQSIAEVDPNKVINQRYRLGRALCLKADDKASATAALSFVTLHRVLNNLVTAQDLLRQITTEDILFHEVTVDTIFNLCELLIVELKTLGNEEVLNEVDQLAQRLLEIGHAQNSYSLLAKTYLLISKLALLKQDVEDAKEMLTQAHQVAVEKGYELLSVVITSEQKRLEKDLPDWFLDEDVSLFERLGHTRLDGLLVALRQDRVEYFTPEDLLTKSPNMDELKSFADELTKRRIKW